MGDHSEMDNLARNIAYLRGDTPQDEYAKAVGISQSTISRALNKGVAPSLETVMAIARHHGVSIDDLLTKDFAIDGLAKSQPERLSERKLAIALVAVDRALRAMHLDTTESWGKLSRLVIWALELQDSTYPNGVNTAADRAGFDAQVEVRLRRGGFTDVGQAGQDVKRGNARRKGAAATRQAARAGD